MDLSNQDVRNLLPYFILIEIIEDNEEEVEDLIMLNAVLRTRTFERMDYIPVTSPVYSGFYNSPLHRGLGNSAFYMKFLKMTTTTFAKLAAIFSPIHRYAKINHQGKLAFYKREPPSTTLCSSDCLACFLFWFYNCANQETCSLLFGIHPRKTSRILVLARAVLLAALLDHPDSRVTFPSSDERAVLADIASEKYRGLIGDEQVWGFIDGCKLNVVRSGDQDIQNAHHSGWLKRQVVNNVILFDVTGRIRWYNVNLLGNTHDSAATLPLYSHLRTCNPVEKILADKAFADVSGMLPLNKTRLEATDNGPALVSLRQSIEHGMRIFQEPGTLKMKLCHDPVKRQELLQLSCLLNNFKTVHDKNQISSTFVGNMSDALLEMEFEHICYANEQAQQENRLLAPFQQGLEVMLRNEITKRGLNF